MASNSGRKSNSSDRSTGRKKVVISAQQTNRVRNSKSVPKAKTATRRTTSQRKTATTAPLTQAAQKRADSKRDLRERRLKGQRLKSRLMVGLGIGAVILVIFALVSLYRSSVFAVERVTVVGNAHLSADEVRELAAVPEDATLLRFPASEVESRLEASPWISSATVTRDFPDTMRIRVSEYVPAAIVDTGAAALWLVDDQGWVIAQQTPETTSTLITIRDLEAFEPVEGERSTSEALRNALRVWEGLGPELRERTRVISAPSVDRTALLTKDDITIFVGSADDIKRKDLVARRILEEQAGKVVSINVRTVDRPTWRGVGTQ